MVRWLRALAVLIKKLVRFLAYTGYLTTVCNSSPEEDLGSLSRPLHMWYTDIHTGKVPICIK